MNIKIDEMVFQEGLLHSETKWTVKEVLNGTIIGNHTVDYGEGKLLSIEYEPMDYHSDFYVTTIRKLNDGSLDAPWTDRLNLTGCPPEKYTALVTPKVQEIRNMVISSSSNTLFFKIPEAINYIGLNNLKATTWIFRDTAGVILYRKRYSIDDKLILGVNKNYLQGHGVITLEAIFHTDNHNKSFRGVLDINLEEIGSDRFLAENYLGNDNLYVDTVNILLLSRFARSFGDYNVKVISNGRVIHNYDTIDVLKIDTRNFSVHDIIKVLITYHSNTVTGETSKKFISKEFKLVPKDSMDTLNDSTVDIETVGVTLIKTLAVKMDMGNTDTVELKNGYVITTNGLDNRVIIYKLASNELLGYRGEIYLEDNIDFELVGQVKLRLIDNATLGIMYTYTDTSSGDYNLHLVFKLLHVTSDLETGYSQIFRYYKDITEEIEDAGAGNEEVDNILFNTTVPNIINYSSLNEVVTGHIRYLGLGDNPNPAIDLLYSKVNGDGNVDRLTGYLNGTDFTLMTPEQHVNNDEFTVPDIENYIMVKRLNKSNLLFLNTAAETKVYKVNQ